VKALFSLDDCPCRARERGESSQIIRLAFELYKGLWHGFILIWTFACAL